MSDNGKAKKTLVEISLYEGKISVEFAKGNINMALISHAIRLASLELDNAIIAHNQPKEDIVKPNSTIIDIMRRGKKL